MWIFLLHISVCLCWFSALRDFFFLCFHFSCSLYCKKKSDAKMGRGEESEGCIFLHPDFTRDMLHWQSTVFGISLNLPDTQSWCRRRQATCKRCKIQFFLTFERHILADITVPEAGGGQSFLHLSLSSSFDRSWSESFVSHVRKVIEISNSELNGIHFISHTSHQGRGHITCKLCPALRMVPLAHTRPLWTE